MDHRDTPGGEAVILSDTSTFKEVVDEACNRLWDRRVRYSIRRIREMEDALKTLELELDLMIRGPDV